MSTDQIATIDWQHWPRRWDEQQTRRAGLARRRPRVLLAVRGPKTAPVQN